MKKLFKRTLIFAIMVILVLSLASCDQVKELLGKGDNNDSNPSVENEIWNMSTVYAKAQSLGYNGTLEEFVELVSGRDGANGKDGTNGKDGIGIKGSVIDQNSHLILILTDGTTVDAGAIVVSVETPGVFEVTFDYGDGTLVTTQSENYRVEAPEKPTRENYSFGGWCFEESSLDNEKFLWLFDAYSVTKNMTLYAVWVPTENITPPDEDWEEGWWDNITYDSQSLIFQMTNCSNKQTLASGCERYLAGEDKSYHEPIDVLVRNRNENAYKYTKVNVKYLYDPDNFENYGFSHARDHIISTIDCSSKDNCPDIFCNWVTDMLLVSLKGKFANVFTCDTRYGYNYLNTNISVDEDENYYGYMTDFMRSLTLNPGQIYVIASDYFIDLIRSFFVVPVNVNLFNIAATQVENPLTDFNYDQQVDIEDFFQEVKNGDWTYDRLIQYSKTVYSPAGGTTSENCNDIIGFALGKNGLPAAGMIYSSSAIIMNRTVENGVTKYTYPDSNEKLGKIITKIADMMKIDGIMCMDQQDAVNLGLAGDNATALLAIRHKFTNDTMLFGGVILLGSLEYDEYQNMHKSGGFGVVPVPVFEKGDEYNTQIHITGKAGGITARNTEKFSACSAFLQYQSKHSLEIVEHYYHYNITHYGTAVGVYGNVDMIKYIRNNVNSGFDKFFEDAIGFFFANGINEADRYHTRLADSRYEFTDFTDVYKRQLELKRVNLAYLEEEYAKLPK